MAKNGSPRMKTVHQHEDQDAGSSSQQQLFDEFGYMLPLPAEILIQHKSQQQHVDKDRGLLGLESQECPAPPGRSSAFFLSIGIAQSPQVNADVDQDHQHGRQVDGRLTPNTPL